MRNSNKEDDKMSRLYWFKNQKDYIKELSSESIINIIGTKGSGKTTASLEYLRNDQVIVINCDRLLELPSGEEEDKELGVIREQLKKKYGNLSELEDFSDCYLEIVEFILRKKKKGIIEGNVLQDFSPKKLKGTVIVKRTSILKSYVRAVKRDYKNQYFMNLEKKEHKYLYKIVRLYKIMKRRKSIFHQAREIEKIIDELEEN